ncbi:MAG: TonB-dependent receptor plug domain-containing protein, partial [Pseudomonadota bacterium]
MRFLWLSLFAAASGAASEQPPIDNIIIEAAKTPVTEAELATRISVLDADQIDRELSQNISDLVRFEPGVDVVDQGSRFGFSGISIRGVGGNRVQVEVDGVPAADAFSIGSFSNAGRDFVDINNIQQVEITRGPASALFGSDALGGVVSFITATPQYLLADNESYLDASLGYNSVDSSEVIAITGAQRWGAF